MKMLLLSLITGLLWLPLSVRPAGGEDSTPAPVEPSPQSVQVTVSGEVNSPGTYAVPADSSIISVVAQAGGVTLMALDTVYLTRTQESGRPKRYSIHLTDMQRAGATGWLRDGDTLLVLRGEQYSISGEVNSPGTYRLDPSMTVKEAVIKAGDVTKFGSYRTVVIVRKDGDGKDKTIKAQPDDFVEAGDVLRVKIDYFHAGNGAGQWRCRLTEVCSV